MAVKVSIATTSPILIVLSISLYAEEIVYWRVAMSKRQEEEEEPVIPLDTESFDACAPIQRE